MKECRFNMENIKVAQKKNDMTLQQEGETLYLTAKDVSHQEIIKIKVLPISKIKQLTNFFSRAFHIQLEGKSIEELQIPEKDLMEAERKIIVKGENAEARTQNAMNLLKAKFEGNVNRDRHTKRQKVARKSHDFSFNARKK